MLLGFVLSREELSGSALEEVKRKARIFLVVGVFGFIIAFGGWIYFWLNGIPTDSSNIWFTFLLIVGIVIALVGFLGWAYYREQFDQYFGWAAENKLPG